MGARRARDDEVARWREHGWVLLDGLVPVEEIDAARRRPLPAVPPGRGVPRRPRRRDPAAPGTAGPGRRVPVAGAGPGVPARSAPLAGGLPLPGNRGPQPSGGPSLHRGLRGARPRHERPPAVPGAGVGQVPGHHQLRAAHAHRPEPLVAAPRPGAAVVAPRRVPLPLRRRPHHRPHPSRLGARFHAPAHDDTRSSCPTGIPRLYARRAGAPPVCGARTSPTGPMSFTAPSTSPSPAEPGSC